MQLQFWQLPETVEFAQETSGDEYWSTRCCGLGGEHLVAADLWFEGFECALSPEGSRHDLYVETPDRVFRVQVKATRAPSRHKHCTSAAGTQQFKSGYMFTAAPGTLKQYEGDIDAFAFVATDLRRVIYLSAREVPCMVCVSPEKFTSEACEMSKRAVFGPARI